MKDVLHVEQYMHVPACMYLLGALFTMLEMLYGDDARAPFSHCPCNVI